MNNLIELEVMLTEKQTVVELSQCLQSYKAEIYLQKVLNGVVHEVNLKSLLGLINVRLKNGDHVTVFAEGPEAAGAVQAVAAFLSGKQRS
ncbi:HPr family phosphocarrier protein [Shouchella patagoniensis]|uniref:HPr family phosphocarrier protein n=1 Tax=Shouchella patagoniensis TaxID=228576 RepID=UPI000995BB6E|nr:HPr family phosphocarrier protein [Shouchella patagoniensis]